MSDLRWLAHDGPSAHPAAPGRHGREAVWLRWRARGDHRESPAHAATDRPAPLDAVGVSSGVGAPQVPRTVLVEPVPEDARTEGPSEALIQAIVELKSRNPRFGCPRIARIISLTFGVDIDRNVVYRVLSKHYRPTLGGTGPSWCRSSGTRQTACRVWPLSMRVHRAPELLGARSHGPVHPSPRRSRRAVWATIPSSTETRLKVRRPDWGML